MSQRRRRKSRFCCKTQKFNIAIFGQKPIIPKSQMRSFVRGRELAHERRRASLAEPFATKSLSACTAKNFINQSQKRSFSTQSAQPVNLFFMLRARAAQKMLQALNRLRCHAAGKLAIHARGSKNSPANLRAADRAPFDCMC